MQRVYKLTYNIDLEDKGIIKEELKGIKERALVAIATRLAKNPQHIGGEIQLSETWDCDDLYGSWSLDLIDPIGNCEHTEVLGNRGFTFCTNCEVERPLPFRRYEQKYGAIQKGYQDLKSNVLNLFMRALHTNEALKNSRFIAQRKAIKVNHDALIEVVFHNNELIAIDEREMHYPLAPYDLSFLMKLLDTAVFP